MKKFTFHPLLFSAYSILALYVQNIDRVDFSATYRTFFFTIVIVLLMMSLLKLITKSWHTAGLVSSLVVILFTTFTPLYDSLQLAPGVHPIFRQANVLAAIWATIFILLTWWLIRMFKHPAPVGEFLNIVSILLILFPVIRIGWFFLRPVQQNVEVYNPVRVSFDGQQLRSNDEPLPDIYYIILDEYGRADVLSELMDYDNSAFIDYLEQKGFYVADNSHSNYSITLMSIASSLNSTYLHPYVSPHPDDERNNTKIIKQMVRENKAKTLLQEAGYRFVTFSTGYSITEFPNADIYSMPDNYTNSFEIEYLKTTMLSLGLDSIMGVRARSIMLNTFDQLQKVPETATDRPKFVFAHIMAAHVPFVFGPNGEHVKPWAFPGTQEQTGIPQRTYVSAYKDQVTYVNHLLEETIDTILSKSQRKPIIILQSDHGPESQIDWQSLEASCIKERLSIINAYYFPDADTTLPYDSITPVNSFPLIYNHYLGMNEPLLPDRSYFSIWERSYDYIDVSDRLDTCKTE